MATILFANPIICTLESVSSFMHHFVPVNVLHSWFKHVRSADSGTSPNLITSPVLRNGILAQLQGSRVSDLIVGSTSEVFVAYRTSTGLLNW